MDKNIEQIIKSISNWDDLKQFERNAIKLNRMSEEIKKAISTKTYELGKILIQEKTNLNLDDLSPAEEKIIHVVCEYVGVMKQKGKQTPRTFQQLRNRGLIEAAEKAVCNAKNTQGFQVLEDEDLVNLSYEKIIIDHPDEFSQRAIWFAKQRLGLLNEIEKPPTDIGSPTQVRTEKLLLWLKEEANNNDGIIPPFFNLDAAEVMEINDGKKFSRVHGNIQSRIDFACFLQNYPPLGLTATTPFEKAWGQDNRDWCFPISEMQVAAQSHKWTDEEFEKILAQTSELPGQAHISWKEAYSKNSEKIKEWVTNLEKLSKEQSKDYSLISQSRNSRWSRDELILALNLYLKQQKAPLGKDSKEIEELSLFLNQMAQALNLTNSETFRNINGVYMKLMNFRRFDPSYTNSGKVGLSRGNREEKVVWDEFSEEPQKLNEVVNAIRLAIENFSNGELTENEESNISEAAEGKVLTRLHRFRERSRALVEQCKKHAIAKHGKLVCEACNFDFSLKYGVVGNGIIEVHHTKPVHTLGDNGKTKIEDLSLLCANCHRVVHSSKNWLTIEQLKLAINNQNQSLKL